MPDVSALPIVAGVSGHGAKHGAKAGAALPVSAEGFFQVLAGRLELGAATGLEGIPLTGAEVLPGSNGRPGADKGESLDAALPSGDAASGNAAILAQFAADAFAAIPTQTPAKDTAALAAGAMPALAAATASAARSGEDAGLPAGKELPEALAAGDSSEGEGDPLASSMTTSQARRAGRSSGATSAAPGQLLPPAGADSVPNTSAPELDRVAGQGKDVRVEPALPQLGQAGKAEVALASQTAGAAQPDTALARPFDHLLRHAEAKVNVAVDAPVRTGAFAAEFGEKMVWLAGRNSQWAELSLNPPHLGSVEVRLSMSGGEAGAQFFSPNPGVREAIEAALPKLRELMAEAGINLGQASVREEGFQQRDGTDAKAQAGVSPAGESFGQVQQGGEASLRALRSGLGLVDLYI